MLHGAQPASTAIGTELSAPVAAALDPLVCAILNELAAWDAAALQVAPAIPSPKISHVPSDSRADRRVLRSGTVPCASRCLRRTTGRQRGLVSGDPDGAEVGDWVLIHVGFAISQVDEQEALATRRLLEQLGQEYEQELEELSTSTIE